MSEPFINGSDQGFESFLHQTSLTGLCTVTLNVYSLYSTTLQYSSNVINSQPNLNLNFNSTQKDEEMELTTTAGKEVVDVTIAVEDEVMKLPATAGKEVVNVTFAVEDENT